MSRAAGALLVVGSMGGLFYAWRQEELARANERHAIAEYNAAWTKYQSDYAAWQGTQGQGTDALKHALVGAGVNVMFGWLGDLFKGGGARSTRTPAPTPPRAPVQSPYTPVRGGDLVGPDTGKRLMLDLQRDFGLTRAQAAGVVGNLDHESGGFSQLQEISPLIPGSRGGYGIAQWTGPRRRQYEAWVAERGLDGRSYEANYGFLKHELTETGEKRVLRRLRATTTPEEAARVFSGSSASGNSWDGFLRPGIIHLESRMSRARGYM